MYLPIGKSLGLKPLVILHPAGNKQSEVLRDLERQYVSGLRRKDGRTVGLGL